MAAPTPDAAADKWERKTRGAGSNWKTGVDNPARSYAAGIQAFWGATANPTAVANYNAGVGAVSAADFNASVAGKRDKWLNNTKRALTGNGNGNGG